MQQRLSGLIGQTIRAIDGDLGKVLEFYFDDAKWTIRYLIVETGSWLFGRTVLISLAALGKPDRASGTFSVNLTCDQVRKSPDIDTQRPVSRQHEVELAEYYLWPQYWTSVHGSTAPAIQHPRKKDPLVLEIAAPVRQDDPHLRSTSHITGYTIHALDGEIGSVVDFIADDEKWAIGYLIADTGNWLPGKQLLIKTEWIKGVNWADKSVSLTQTLDTVKNSPDSPI